LELGTGTATIRILYELLGLVAKSTEPVVLRPAFIATCFVPAKLSIQSGMNRASRPGIGFDRGVGTAVAMASPPSPRGRKVVLALVLVGALGIESCSRIGGSSRSSIGSSDSKVSVAPDTIVPPQSCGLPFGLQRPEWPKILGSTLGRERDPAPPGSVTIVLLPDTQYYVSCRYPHLGNQSHWIVSERVTRQIRAAISLGDLTDHNSPEEWTFVRDAFGPLGKGFPLLLTTGNHDVGSRGTTDGRDSLLSKYFDESWAASNGSLRAVMTPGSIENAFYSLDLGRFRLGVLMLEWSPRQATVAWANRVLERAADHRVIIATHAYVYDDSTRYDHATRKDQLWSPFDYATAQGERALDGSHDGEMLWNALVRRHAGIFLVVSGHVLGQGTGRLTSFGDAGNAVHQVLVNYQMLDEGGLGYLRFFEIYPDGRTLHMKTYSPSLDLYSYAADQDFRLEIEPPL
jgi:hypothetical protein